MDNPNILQNKCFKGTIVNQTCNCLSEGTLESPVKQIYFLSSLAYYSEAFEDQACCQEV